MMVALCPCQAGLLRRCSRTPPLLQSLRNPCVCRERLRGSPQRQATQRAGWPSDPNGRGSVLLLRIQSVQTINITVVSSPLHQAPTPFACR
jgi:hypothetical protein